MRSIFLLLLVSAFLPLPVSSFASSRQEIIDKTLKETENTATYQDSLFSKTTGPYVQTVNTPGITVRPTHYEDTEKSTPREMILEREIAMEKAFYIAAGYDYNHIHYSEWAEGNKLDEDFGSQDGFYVNAGYRSPDYCQWLMGKPFVEGYYRRYKGNIKYKGAAFDGFGNTFPFNTKQKSSIERFGLKVGAYRDFLYQGELFGYLDLGRRVWFRGQNGIEDGVLLYKEKYSWFYAGMGMGMNYKFFEKFSAGIEGEWFFTFKNWSKMYAYASDGLEAGTFRIKGVWGAEFKLPIRYYLLKSLSVDFTPYFTYWHIRKSDPIQSSGMWLYEPDSKTHEEGLLTGLTYLF